METKPLLVAIVSVLLATLLLGVGIYFSAKNSKNDVLHGSIEPVDSHTVVATIEQPTLLG